MQVKAGRQDASGLFLCSEVAMRRPSARDVKCYVNGVEQPTWVCADEYAGFCVRWVLDRRGRYVQLGQRYAQETIFGRVKMRLA